jgi:threonyl-tRNA synthetase
MLIIGEQESNQEMVSVRSHGGKVFGVMKVEDFVKIIKEQIKI